MAKVVTDFFQRKASGKEVRRTGMAQYVRTAVRGLYPQALHAAGHHTVETFGGHRPMWSKYFKEHLLIGASLPDLPEVAKDGVADDWDERVSLGPSSLGTRDAYLVVLPVDIFQPKRRDFVGPQSVNGEEHENCSVADIDGVVHLEAIKQSADLVP